ncbi:uncharacterized protein [Dysidea avara]|uniref:uncharacterized protein isoform X2 n=1 Tax=Dysidea avara TaxID=196820 RepID=UPI003322F707
MLNRDVSVIGTVYFSLMLVNSCAAQGGVPRVVILRRPAGILVDESANTFDYPILGSINLTCIATSNDGSTFMVTNYKWNTAGCYTNPAYNSGNPTCFPHGRTTQCVTENELTAKDAGIFSCTVTIAGVEYTSNSLTIRISGITMTGVSQDGGEQIGSSNELPNNLVVTVPTLSLFGLIARCITGLAPPGIDNTVLGGWYFNGTKVPLGYCNSGPVVQAHSANISIDDFAGIINLHLCEASLSTATEGVYSCTMMNSSMMNQTMRVGVYFGGRTAPLIDPPSSSTMTVVTGSSITLSCTSRGSPPDTFTWRKDSGPIVQSTSIIRVSHTNTIAVFRADYTIDSVTTNDSGIYTCTVTNPIGSSSGTVSFTVVAVTIVGNPAGTPVSGSTNTFDFPILSSVTLTCIVTSSNGLMLDVTNYQWNTTGCYTTVDRNSGNPTCFPDGQTTQSVTGSDLTAEDAGIISCTVTIGGDVYTSIPLTLRISGITITGLVLGNSDIVSGNILPDYSFVSELTSALIARCVTGLSPLGNDNTVLGGWYFNGAQIPTGACSGPVIQPLGESVMSFVGVINLRQCGTFTTTEEGVYSCIMMNSSVMEQTMRVGIYFSKRTAPLIHPPSQPTVTVVTGSLLTLSCTSHGSPPDTFTWRKNSGPMLQSASIITVTHTNTSAVFRADYIIDSVTTSDNGTYTCTVINPIGSSSGTITVDVIGLPEVIVMPSSQSVEVTHTATFTTRVSGVRVENFMYQWRHNGIVITGETRGTLMITNVMESDSGDYECIVTNEYGDNGTSNVVVLVVTRVPPVITTQPLDTIVGLTDDTTAVSQTCEADGATSYHWERQNSSITSGAIGINTNTITITNLRLEDTGNYRCIATNASGSTPSNYAMISVNDVVCSPTNDVWGITWLSAVAGSITTQRCPNFMIGLAYRRCLQDGTWDSLINLTECQTTEFVILLDRVRELEENLSVNSDVVSEVEDISEELNNITSISVGKLFPNDLLVVIEIINVIARVIQSANMVSTDHNSLQDFDMILNDVAATVDTLLSRSNNISFRESQNAGILSVGEDLLKSIEMFAVAVGNITNKNISTHHDNIIIEVQLLPTLISNSITFPNDTLASNFSGTQIAIPASAIRHQREVEGVVVPVVNFVANNLQFYINDPFLSERYRPSSGVVISTQFSQGSINLTGDASVIVKFNSLGGTPEVGTTLCVFWDFTSRSQNNQSTGRWSSSGIIQDNDHRPPVICRATHLTSFSVLVSSVDADENYPELHIVSYVGCSVSIVCLLLTIGAILLLRKSVFKAKHHKVHLNLSIALLLGLITFVSGIETAEGWGCNVVAIFLHYFFLSMFCWTLCEAIMVFVLFVTIFYKGIFQDIRFFLLLGWGLPIPIVAISAGLSYDDYVIKGTESVMDEDGIKAYREINIACWISDKNGAIWAFTGPVILILLINMILLSLSIMNIYYLRRRHDNQKARFETAKILLLTTAVLVPLLGGTWILGLLFVIDNDSIVLAWIFTIVNSLQVKNVIKEKFKLWKREKMLKSSLKNTTLQRQTLQSNFILQNKGTVLHTGNCSSSKDSNHH